jgi:hypothetical protein
VSICWSYAEEGIVRCGQVKCLGGQDVQKTSGGVESLSPVRRDACLKKERTNGVIDGANNTFGFGEEESAGAGVVKLVAVITLNSLDGNAKLGMHIGEEISKGGKSVRLEAEGKSPKVM